MRAVLEGLGDRLLRPEVSRGEGDLHLDLPDLLVDDQRAMTRVVAILLELLPELEKALAIDVDAARGTPRVVLSDDQDHRHTNVFYVRDRMPFPIFFGNLGGRATDEPVVVFLVGLHLPLLGR